MSAPPSIESPNIGVRRIVIDVAEHSPEATALSSNLAEVRLFGLILGPRRIGRSKGGREVWELTALREASFDPGASS